MKTYILSIPTKKSDDVNWLSPLKNYIASIYGSTNEYESDLNGFNKLRQDLRGVNPDVTGITLYYKYYSQLELLDLRVPVGRITGKKVSFIWYDAFSKSISHKQHSLPFEKANILFNIASLLSQIGAHKYEESQRTTAIETADSSTKEVIQMFQQVAGILEFISENFLHAPSDDLNQSSLKFLSKLMLAQTQEVFVLKVITGDMNQTKNSLIAKLCSSAANHYLECTNMIDYSENLKESVSTTDFDIIDTNEELEDLQDVTEHPKKDKITIKLELLWVSLITFKHFYYKSLAYYFNGLHLEKSKKFGEAIVNFTKSSEIIDQIDSITLKQISRSNEGFEVLDNYKYHKDSLTIKLNDLNKDNDLIYHEIIPSVVTLAEIKPLDSAKMIPLTEIKMFNDINEHNYNNFLKNVVPIDIHELLSYYSEEKSQFLRNELDMVDVSNEELSSVLEYLKMPKSLINLKQIITENKASQADGEISKDVIAKVNEIAREYSNDTGNKAEIIQIRKTIYSIINEIESTANFNHKDDIVKLKKSLYDATTSDDKLFGLIDIENSKLYDILGNGSNSKQFKQLFEVPTKSAAPEISLLDLVDTPQNDNVEKDIKNLEDILYDLNVIKANKQKLVDTLKKEIHNDDISDILVLNSKVKTTNEIKNVIFPEELKKFQPYADELDNLIEKQKTFINNLKDEWSRLSENPKVRDIQSSKTFKDTLIIDQVTRIEDFYTNNWKRYNEGLKRGIGFYKQLKSHAEMLRERVGSDVNDRFSSMSLGPKQVPHQYSGAPTGQQYSGAQVPHQYSGAQVPQQYSGPQVPQQYSGSQVPQQYSGSQAPQQYSGSQAPQQYSGSQYPSSQYSGSQYPGQQPQQYPQNYPQPMLNRKGSDAPSLPPKQPYQSFQSPPPPYQQRPSYGQGSGQGRGQFPSYQGQGQQQPQGQPPQRPVAPQGQPQGQGQGNLIYDQPSTYNPNMYNFFSKD